MKWRYCGGKKHTLRCWRPLFHKLENGTSKGIQEFKSQRNKLATLFPMILYWKCLLFLQFVSKFKDLGILWRNELLCDRNNNQALVPKYGVNYESSSTSQGWPHVFISTILLYAIGSHTFCCLLNWHFIFSTFNVILGLPLPLFISSTWINTLFLICSLISLLCK